MATFAMTDVRKSFGPVEVIRGITLELADGEFLALVGPSGCGKSTLLRMIAGLETVTSGTVRIGGRVVNELEPRDRDIAMVFQSYALYPNQTVRRNIGQPLRLARLPRAEVARRVDEAARVLGLDTLLDRYPRALSGGQRQRVAMGRAIVRDPSVFLFDEPLSNLDAQLRVQMRAEIKDLVKRLGTTTVYVTHDQVEAMTMADRVAVMRAGVVEQLGTPFDLYDRPANIFVAGFVGSPSMNLVDGLVRRGADGVGLAIAGGAAVPLPPETALPEGARAILGLRPETLDLAPVGSGRPAIRATVRVVEATGSDTLVTLHAGGGEMRVFLRERRDVVPGAEVDILLPAPQARHLFDAGTGRRVSAS